MVDNCAKCGKKLDWAGRNAYWNRQLKKGYLEIDRNYRMWPEFKALVGIKSECPEYKNKKLCRSCFVEVLDSNAKGDKENKSSSVTEISLQQTNATSPFRIMKEIVVSDKMSDEEIKSSDIFEGVEYWEGDKKVLSSMSGDMLVTRTDVRLIQKGPFTKNNQKLARAQQVCQWGIRHKL